MTILYALNSILEDSSKPTERTMKRVNYLLGYMHTNPYDAIHYHASDMVLNVHPDASYLSAGCGRSHTGGIFFLGHLLRDGTPVKLNEKIVITCAILKLGAASASIVEAELGALFPDVQEARILQLTLYQMGHPQPQTPVHVDNTLCVGIINITTKR